MAYTGTTENASADQRVSQSPKQSFTGDQLSSARNYNDYEPQEDYIYKPVSETDPWFTSDMIEVLSTQGGELFIKRNDGSMPSNAAETYVGPYFRWLREPQYGSTAQSTFGRTNDLVLGSSYYGLYGKGKPKNKGLRANQILEALSGILRTTLGGPQFLAASSTDPNIIPSGTSADIKEASKQGVLLSETAEVSDTLSGAITLKDTGDKKYIHITDAVTMEPAHIVLGRPDTNMRELGGIATKFGMKGRAPVITNQPNAKIDFGNEPLG